MKVTTLLQIVIAFALGAGSAAYAIGCPETRLYFDAETGKITPVVSTGDVVMWDVAVEWIDPKQTPCDAKEFAASSGKKCKIVASANGGIFPYFCRSEDCDPDIVVDDDFKPLQPEVRPAGASGGSGSPAGGGGARTVTARTQPYVYLFCNADAEPDVIELRPSDKNDRTTNEEVQWLARGLPLPTSWKVTLEGTDDEKTAFCKENDFELTAGEKCTLAQPSGTWIDYTATATNCAEVKGKVTVK